MTDISGVTGTQLIDDAEQNWVGIVPYLWGGITKAGADCSGFILALFAENGVTINGRDTEQQVQDGTAVPIGPASDPLEYAVPGDVVFFGLNNASLDDQHEGLYIGNNQMIDEPHTGAKAEVDPVIGWDASEPLSAIRSFVPATDSATAAAAAGVGGAVDTSAVTSATSVLSNTGTTIIDALAYLLFFAAGVGLVAVGAWKVANPGKSITETTTNTGGQP